MPTPTHETPVPGSAIDALVDEYLAAMPDLDPLTARISVGLWRHLAQGHPVAKSALADTLGVARDELDKALAGPLAGTYSQDDRGQIRAFWALSLPDQVSPHRLLLDGRTLYAWCAADTLFLPLLIGQTVKVESSLTTTDEPIRLEVHPDRLGEVQGPEEVAVSFVRAAPEGLGDSPAAIMSTYCHHMLFFPNPEIGREWARQHDRGDLVVLPLPEAFDACQRIFRSLLGNALDR